MSLHSSCWRVRKLRGGNSETGFSHIPMLTYGESLGHDKSLSNLIKIYF